MLPVATSDNAILRVGFEAEYGVPPPGGTIAVDDASNTAPIVIETATAHGKVTGNNVKIAAVGGNTNANGEWDIKVLDASTFELVGSQGNGAYTSGGTVEHQAFAVAITSESIKPRTDKQRSKIITPGRQAKGLVVMARSAEGSIVSELTYREFDRLIAAALQSQWEVYGHRGVGAAFTGTISGGNTMTASVAPTGASALTKLKKGDWFLLSGSSIANANGLIQVSKSTAPTSTVVVCEGTPFATNGAAGAACRISSSRIMNGSLQRSATTEKEFSDITKCLAAVGQVLSDWKLTFKTGDFCGIDFAFKGADGKPMGSVSLLPGTPTPSLGFDSFSNADGLQRVQEGGADLVNTTMTSVELSITNQVRERRGLGKPAPFGQASGQFMYSGRSEYFFVDEVLYNKFVNNSPTSMSWFIGDLAGNGYVFVLPCMKYSGEAPAASGINTDVMMQMGFESDPDLLNNYGGEAWGKTLLIFRVGTAV